MTETSPIVTISHKDRFHKYSSIGHPVPLTQMKVVDVDTGKSLPPRQSGEIHVKGPQVRLNYKILLKMSGCAKLKINFFFLGNERISKSSGRKS